MSLRDYGFDEYFSNAWEELQVDSLSPGRILFASGREFRLVLPDGESRATLAGRVRHRAESAASIPAVGDWVAASRTGDEARIEQILPRRTQLSRKVAGSRTDEQVVAANVDLVFVVMGLDGDFSTGRLERMLTMVWESGARPAIVLNKTDLLSDWEEPMSQVREVARGAPVLPLSCKLGSGTDAVVAEIAQGETAVLLGSSGVGKSSLINRLLGEQVQAIRQVRRGDDRGRHTTSHRELFRLPDGGLLIDCPGVREVQLWSGEASLDRTFQEIVELASDCRYRDCSHENEPGCSVLAAISDGRLDRRRLESYRSLQKELRYLEARQSESAQRVEKGKWRAIHREMRKSTKKRRRS